MPQFKVTSDYYLQQLPIGKLISGKMMENHVASIPGISDKILIELKQDNFWPNSIPIVLFRNMLRLLDISFNDAKKSIYLTASILEEKKRKDREGKSNYETRSDLWECKKAVDIYVNRLEELMPTADSKLFSSELLDWINKEKWEPTTDGWWYNDNNDEGDSYQTTSQLIDLFIKTKTP
jgi:hypothetical protein